MTDLNDNAKAAVREFAAYIGQSNKCERYLEAFETKKTVADAVEYYNGSWPEEKDAVCVWDDKNKNFEFWISDYEPVSYCYEVCNYEQFEAYVKEQEGEKWTHIDVFGDPCRILIEEKDRLGYVVILRQSGHYATPAASSLKPIKPTITKADFADFVIESLNDGTHQSAVCYMLQEKLDTHDII